MTVAERTRPIEVSDSLRILVANSFTTSELVPQLFDQATGRPNGTRGWVAWARIGHDVVNANGLRLLSNS